MTTSVSSSHTASGTRLRVAGILLATAVVVIAVNAGAAAVAVSLGAPADYGPLTLPAHALFAVLGIAVGWIGWSLVVRRARHPRRVLAVLVPAVTAVSFVPDLLLMAFSFIPGTTMVAVVALMVMHVVVVAVAVPAYVLASPRGSLARG
ncbi:DUF6069 family protein [Herbiconiux sp. CPCC 203407]|uniref:DUF6069 family protein n=1 Tax=Herbiconiux oxytropis TaxID=2970915 RepID=A0AA41XE63_9MICO|nr:DUF6069 family protein [Herbiconiux oxytropis]MCS5723439.1 DUF6069 family protein [Herbiconiux oxytropis]MCS5726526.1 DUF6069 family protein [Herbiconiux oxytropis]